MHMNLIINRVKFVFQNDNNNTMIFSKDDHKLLFASSFEKLSLSLGNKKFDEWGAQNGFKPSDRIYYDFKSKDFRNNIFECGVEEYFYPKLIKRILLEELWKQGLIVDITTKTFDISAYKRVGEYDSTWDVYYRYDLKIHKRINEISVSLGSEYSLISKYPIPAQKNNDPKIIQDNAILPYIKPSTDGKYKILANAEIKKSLSNSATPKPLKYREKYSQILSFYQTYLKNITSKGFSFTSQGLLNVDFRKAFKVNISENKMIFRDGKTDINPVTGMRDYGVYKESPIAHRTEFIFIYSNNNDANTLYKYLKNGYKNFPGLERYVGVPMILSDKKGFKYTEGTLEDDYQKFEQTELSNEYYDHLFAIVIGKFDKNNTTDDVTNEYYSIKKAFLKKRIPTQFINEQHIRQSNIFNFHLPNIAIGIVAKLGGIPWRLKNNINQDLIVGFNQVRLADQKYIGGSVFFTNEGLLEAVYSYPKADSEQELINFLRNSILAYIAQKGDIRRLIIHYYKPNNQKEKENIEKLLYRELKMNISYALIEINDTKTQSDICFDAGYDMGVPISGTYVEVGNNEYLLFNNTRHIERPITKVEDELPIKIKIHFADNSGFSHNELISQIYEFSRLIWKGLKQRSQPATTIYAKLIADFSAHFNGDIPQNSLTQKTPWFI